MSATCASCNKVLLGNWIMTSADRSTNGRSLGVMANYYNGECESDFIKSYCNGCWKKRILTASFVKAEIAREKNILQGVIESLTICRGDLNSQLIASKEEIEKLQNEIKELKEKNEDKDQKILLLQANLWESKEENNKLQDENDLLRESSIQINTNNSPQKYKMIDFSCYKKNFIDDIHIYALELHQSIEEIFKSYSENNVDQLQKKLLHQSIEKEIKNTLTALKKEGDEAITKIKANSASVINLIIDEKTEDLSSILKSIEEISKIIEQNKLLGAGIISSMLMPAQDIKNDLEKEIEQWRSNHSKLVPTKEI